MVRAHTEVPSGYAFMYFDKEKDPEQRKPKLITIFSAPNYHPGVEGKAGIMLHSPEDEEGAYDVRVFDEVAQPWVPMIEYQTPKERQAKKRSCIMLPVDAFTYTIP